MTDILIRGMEMPKKKPICVVIDAAGQARQYDLLNDCYYDMNLYEVIKLPPHGDLIDADSLADDLLYDAELADRALSDMSLVGSEREHIQSEKDIKQNCAYYVSHAPVVIPAKEVDE